MDDRGYPILGTGEVDKAYPDIKVGSVLKAFPDIDVGQVIKIDRDALDIDPSNGDKFGVLVLDAEGDGGLRIAAGYGGREDEAALSELMSEIRDVVGALDVSVLEVEGSALTVEVTAISTPPANQQD